MWPMHPHYWTWWRCHKDLTLPHSFHLPGRSLGDLQTQQDHLFYLPTRESVHLLWPTVLPKGRVVRCQAHLRWGNLISWTQVTNPHLSVLILFDVCGAIGNTCTWLNHTILCEGLHLEWEYRLKEKYMCEKSWGRCDDLDYSYCSYWSCIAWAPWKDEDKTALLQQGIANPTLH